MDSGWLTGWLLPSYSWQGLVCTSVHSMLTVPFVLFPQVEGTEERPRLAVFRSNTHIYAQASGAGGSLSGHQLDCAFCTSDANSSFALALIGWCYVPGVCTTTVAAGMPLAA